MKIGICGIGKMGYAITERLCALDQDVTVWNRTASKLAGLDVDIAASPKELVETCDVVLSVLASDRAIDAVYNGENGLLCGDLKSCTLVEMCTTSPEKAEWLNAQVIERGGQFLECPVGGTIGPAREGKLLGMAGGSDVAFAAARPVLEMITRRLEHLGDAGAGAAMKLSINLPLMIYWGALGEALSLVLKRGISAERALDILSDSSGAIGAAKVRIKPIEHMMTTGIAQPPNFSLELAQKDIRLMAALAAANGHETPVLNALAQTAQQAAADGWGENDVSLLAAWRNRTKG